VIPPSTDLEALYITQGLNAREIAQRYDVAHITVLRWMKRYGIARRPPGRGLAHRGHALPTRAELERLIYVERLTYQEVGQKYAIDKTAIPYWLDRLGIPRPTRTRVVPADVRRLYEAGLSAETIASDLGCGKTTVLNFLRRMDIVRRHEGWRPRLATEDGTIVRSTYELRVADWLYSHDVAYEYEPKVPFGHHRTRADFLANGWYIEVWGVHSSPGYKVQRGRKTRSYRELGLPLIELLPHHFSQAKHIFERRMTCCLQGAQSSGD